eukprot:470505-Pelagomonas_calceolata.AAC.1
MDLQIPSTEQNLQLFLWHSNKGKLTLPQEMNSIHFYKVKAHSGIIGNEGAYACARSAALTAITD